MDIWNTLKNAFPKPRIPQKRYLMVAGIVLYYVAKAYVAYTPTPDDDHLPDQMRGVIIDYFADAETQPDPSEDYDKDGLKYGEGYA